jgi:hypothetical protein
MAADINEITDCNQPDILRVPDDLSEDPLIARLDHILCDLHDALKILAEQAKLTAKHDAMLEQYRPLLARFASPLASRLPGGKKTRG